MKRLNTVELLLTIVAIGAGISSAVFGLRTETLHSTGRLLEKNFSNKWGVEHVANSLDTGFDGGAIGLGIISASCFLGIIWIEITRFTYKQQQ